MWGGCPRLPVKYTVKTISLYKKGIYAFGLHIQGNPGILCGFRNTSETEQYLITIYIYTIVYTIVYTIYVPLQQRVYIVLNPDFRSYTAVLVSPPSTLCAYLYLQIHFCSRAPAIELLGNQREGKLGY